MPTLKLTVQADLDGVPLSGFPVVRRLVVTEVQTFETARPAQPGTWYSLPVVELATLNALIVQTDQPITLRLDGQTDRGINLAAGGLVVLFDVHMDAGYLTNATSANNGTATAIVSGLGGGQ
jgi:hypothetical protein